MAIRLEPEDFIDMPWKNGGGVTRELYRLPGEPGSDFGLRISMARVGQSGPFSLFPGIDRILMLVDGAGFKLDMNGQVYTLDTPFVPLAFSGEEPVACTLLGGESLDFNVMSDRHWGQAELQVHELAPGQIYRCHSVTPRLLYRHATGQYAEPELWVLAPGDSLDLTADEQGATLVDIILYPLIGV
ncbi:MAG: HutD family protein [Oceanisphaera sp.]|uniref:HutD/Ves family protein n=1 Tax=Oceanisphaera sp. TaxID=1929979 RepID=UPI003C772103